MPINNNTKNYLTNIGKSFLFGSKNVMEEIMPNTANLIKDGIEVTKTVFDGAKNIKIDDGNENGYFQKTFKKAIDNALHELKTGNVLTKETMDKSLNAQMGSELSSLMDDITNILNDDEDSLSSINNDNDDIVENIENEENIDDSTEGLTVFEKTNNRTLMRTVTNNIKLGSTAEQKLTNQLLLTNIKAITSGIQTSTSSVLNSIANVNTFNEEVTRKFYNDVSEKLSNIHTSISIMSKSYNEAENYKHKSRLRELQDNLLNQNSIISSLRDIAKYNSSLNSMGDMKDILMRAGDSFAENPTGQLLMSGIKKLIPGNLIKSFTRIDDVIGSLPVTTQYMFQNWKNSDNKYLKKVGSLFSMDLKNKREIYTGQYQKGTIAYNGLANRAIINVIPSLLSKILSAVTDNPFYKDELIYDYDKGQFTNKSVVKRETNRKFQDAVKDSTRFSREKIISQMDQETLTQKDIDDLTTAIFTMSRDGKNFSNYKAGELTKNQKVEEALRNFTKDSADNASFNKELFEGTRRLQTEYDNFSGSGNIAGQMAIDYSNGGLYRRGRNEEAQYNLKYERQKQARERQERIRHELESGNSHIGDNLAKSLDKATDAFNEILTGNFDIGRYLNFPERETRFQNERVQNIYNKVKEKAKTAEEKLREKYDNSTQASHNHTRSSLNPINEDDEERLSASGTITKNLYVPENSPIIPPSTPFESPNETFTKKIYDKLLNILDGSQPAYVIIKGGYIDRIKNTVLTDEVKTVDKNASYNEMKSKAEEEALENQNGQDSLDEMANDNANEQNERIKAYHDRISKMQDEINGETDLQQGHKILENTVDKMVDNSILGRAVSSKLESAKVKLSNTKVGQAFLQATGLGKKSSYSTPNEVINAGMTPVWIMGSNTNIENSNNNANNPLNPNNSNSIKDILKTGFNKGTNLLGKGASFIGNKLSSNNGTLGKIGRLFTLTGSGLTGLSADLLLNVGKRTTSSIFSKNKNLLGKGASVLGDKLSDKSGVAGKVGGIFNKISGKLINNPTNNENNTEEEISDMQMKRAILRENLKDKASVAREKVKDLWANKNEIMRSGIEKAQTLATQAKKSVIELTGASSREALKMKGAKALEVIKKGWGIAKEAGKSAIELGGSAIKGLATATSAMPVVGPLLATSGILAGSALLGTAVKSILKKFSKNSEKPPTSQNNIQNVEKSFSLTKSTKNSKSKKSKDENNDTTYYNPDGDVTAEPVITPQTIKTGKSKEISTTNEGETSNKKNHSLNGIYGNIANLLGFGKASLNRNEIKIDNKVQLSLVDVRLKGMTPVWIMGSNIDTSHPTDTLTEMRERRQRENENLKTNKEKNKFMSKISDNIRGLVKGFTSLFANGISGLTSSSGNNSSNSNSGGGGGSFSSSSTGHINSGNSSYDDINTIINQDLGDWSDMTEDEMNDWISSQAPSNSPFIGQGKIFLDAAKQSGLDPRYILAHAAIESGWGTSTYAVRDHNYFGIGAFDSNPDNAREYGNGDLATGIIEGSKWIARNFHDNEDYDQKTLHSMRWNNGSHQYATDENWDTKIASIMATAPATTSYSENSTSTTATPASAEATPIDKAVQWAVDIANDDSHGYSQINRTGPDYDCSSLVSTAYENAGIPLFSKGGSSTSSMYNVAKELGFQDVTEITGHGTDVSQLQKGDILLIPGQHTEMYIGNGQLVGAHLDENGDIIGTTSGDQTGNEISVGDLWQPSGGWTYVLRYPGGSNVALSSNGTASSTSSNTSSSSSSNTISSGTGKFDSTAPITQAEKDKAELDEKIKNGTFGYESAIYNKGDGTYVNPGDDTKVNDGMTSSGYNAENSSATPAYGKASISKFLPSSSGNGLSNKIKQGLNVNETNASIITDSDSAESTGGIIYPSDSNSSSSNNDDGSTTGATIIKPDNNNTNNGTTVINPNTNNNYDNNNSTSNSSNNVINNNYNNTTINNGDNSNSSIANIISQLQPDKYYDKVLDYLKLVEDHTSNIPITNEILNKILDKLNKNKENSNNNLINNTTNGLAENSNVFASIDNDIKLIASGV